MRDRASETALGVAAVRWAATQEKREEIRGSDSLAYLFLDLKFRILAGPLFGLSRWLYRRLLPGTYEWLIARTKHYDRLVEQLPDEIEQLVILGAGYDTRALRFAESLEAGGVRVFELDHPATQARKRRCLGPRLPAHVTFVPTDFQTQALAESLERGGYDPTRKSAFIWEGVTMYLSEEGVERTLSAIVDSSPAGGLLYFDYCNQTMIDGIDCHYGGREIRRYVDRRGEHLMWGIAPDKVSAFLDVHGLSLVRQWGPDDIQNDYLTLDDGTLFGRIADFNWLVAAKIG